jgi:hypothetical protein
MRYLRCCLEKRVSFVPHGSLFNSKVGLEADQMGETDTQPYGKGTAQRGLERWP